MSTIKELNKKSYKELSIKYSIGFIIAFISFIIFLDFGSQVKGIDSGIYFDKRVISEVSQLVTPSIKRVMIFISFIGSAKFYIPISIALIYYFYKRKQLLNIIALLSGILGSAIMNFLIKGYYQRMRPEDFFQIKELGFSFPSGHSMVGISAYFMLTYIFFRDKPWNTKKILAWATTVLLVVSIGLSRIYLGVHWPTDVIGGFALGFIWIYVNIIIIDTFVRKKTRDNI